MGMTGEDLIVQADDSLPLGDRLTITAPGQSFTPNFSAILPGFKRAYDHGVYDLEPEDFDYMIDLFGPVEALRVVSGGDIRMYVTPLRSEDRLVLGRGDEPRVHLLIADKVAFVCGAIPSYWVTGRGLYSIQNRVLTQEESAQYRTCRLCFGPSHWRRSFGPSHWRRTGRNT